MDRVEEFYFKDGNLLWLRGINKDYSPIFVKHTFDALFETQREQLIHGAAYNALTIQALKGFKIPSVPRVVQEELVDKITTEKQLIEGNKKLIQIYTQKIQDRISKVWGEGIEPETSITD